MKIVHCRCILTPNAVEFDRLLTAAVKEDSYDEANPVELQAYHLSRLLGGVTILRKGKRTWHCVI